MVYLAILFLLPCVWGFSNKFMVRTRNQGVLQMFNKIMHVSVNTNDIDKVKQFYSNTFTGLVTEEPSSSSVMIRSNDKKLGVEFKSTNEKINLGNAFGGIGIRYQNSLDAMDGCFLNGGEVVADFGEYKYGASEIPDEDDLKQTAIQYGRMKDVNGYKVELLQSSSTTTSIYKLVIGVLDLNDSIDFYTKVLQMKLLRKRSNVNNVPKSASMCAYCGYSDEANGPIIELVYSYATDRIDVGSSINQIVLGTSDLDASMKHVQSLGQTIMESKQGRCFEILDPNGVTIKVRQVAGLHMM